MGRAEELCQYCAVVISDKKVELYRSSLKYSLEMVILVCAHAAMHTADYRFRVYVSRTCEVIARRRIRSLISACHTPHLTTNDALTDYDSLRTIRVKLADASFLEGKKGAKVDVLKKYSH